MSEHERIAPVAHYKRATMSDLLTLLFKKERKVRFAQKTQANRTFALSITKNERFARKTDERIPSPDFNVGYTIYKVEYTYNRVGQFFRI